MSKNKKELLFSLNKNDFEIDTFRAGGAGGQHQNTRETGVRIRHPESGAVGESRNFRTQKRNKEAAFKRMYKSEKFQNWHKTKVGYALQGIQDFKKHIEKEVEKEMRPENLKIEYGDEIDM